MRVSSAELWSYEPILEYPAFEGALWRASLEIPSAKMREDDSSELTAALASFCIAALTIYFHYMDSRNEVFFTKWSDSMRGSCSSFSTQGHRDWNVDTSRTIQWNRVCASELSSSSLWIDTSDGNHEKFDPRVIR